MALPKPGDIDGFEPIVEALQRAQRLPAAGPAFSICIADDDGTPVAGATLGSFDQVKRFSARMSKLGYSAQIIETVGEVKCDVLYLRAQQARNIFDNGEPDDTAGGPE